MTFIGCDIGFGQDGYAGIFRARMKRARVSLTAPSERHIYSHRPTEEQSSVGATSSGRGDLPAQCRSYGAGEYPGTMGSYKYSAPLELKRGRTSMKY